MSDRAHGADAVHDRKTLPHPLVRRAQRAAELAMIEAWCARHGVTRCLPAFVTLTPQAAHYPVIVPRAEATAARTIEDCAAWLKDHGHAVARAPDGEWQVDGRRLQETQLIERVARLQAQAETTRAVARAGILEVLTGYVVAGRPCPTARSLHRALMRRRLYVPRDDGIEDLMRALVADGAIALDVGADNVRIVTLLTGPHAGRSSAVPPPRGPLAA